jgi:hypothetical protein
MGRQVNLEAPLSPEDKKDLIERGRGYLIFANERRFGEDGTRTPEPHEAAGAPSQSPFYDSQERERAVYDVGGAPLPGTVLDYDAGRVLDRDNGVLVEYTGPGHTPGGFNLEPEGFVSHSDEDDDDIDEDIVQEVLGLHVAGLKGRLTTLGVDVDPKDKKEDLQNKLAIALQDARDAEKK